MIETRRRRYAQRLADGRIEITHGRLLGSIRAVMMFDPPQAVRVNGQWFVQAPEQLGRHLDIEWEDASPTRPVVAEQLRDEARGDLQASGG